jgi:hypothetical protein
MLSLLGEMESRKTACACFSSIDFGIEGLNVGIISVSVSIVGACVAIARFNVNVNEM